MDDKRTRLQKGEAQSNNGQNSSPFFMNTLQRFSYGSAIASMGLVTMVSRALAGDSNLGGTGGVPGSAETNIRVTVLRLLNTVLNFLALIAVIFIIVAGIRLIASQGEQEQKDKAKKTIIYVVIGLVVVLLAKVIVGWVTGAAVRAA
ncbi:MAG: hypothetical protein Greene041619_693 [Candidatus Peregrinibacteria bacterium Greene0416_19]|nr:MAG: hypothetical protein Greene041619_693 [Candidatus Peregrinibacteria bacterium Greene0416_19]